MSNWIEARARGDFRLRTAIAAVLIAFVGILAMRGLTLTYYHPDKSIDGAMQTWFAVRNFARGSQLGHDFQSYLGISSMLTLVPWFVALGETLWAATMSSHIMVAIGHGLTVYVCLRLVRWVPNGWCLVLTGLVFVVLTVFGAKRLVEPMYSLRPLRWALPFILALIAQPQLRRALVGEWLRPGLVIGLATGVGFLWSNDAGIPAFLAMIGAILACLWGRWATLAKLMATFLLATFAGAALLLLVVTHGEPMAWLHYNFGSVAGDQPWYFGPWDREAQVMGPADLGMIFWVMLPFSMMTAAFLLVTLAIALWMRLKGKGPPVRLGLFVLVASGALGSALLPQVGGHIELGYNRAMWIPGLAAPLILAGSQGLRAARRFVRWTGRKEARQFTLLFLGAFLLWAGIEAGKFVAKRADKVPVAALGIRLTPEGAADVEAFASQAREWDRRGVPEDRRLLSVYTSMFDLSMGDKVQSPTPFGSIIHALGEEERALFTSRVEERQVEAVTTIYPPYDSWGSWNWRANWPFFEALLRNYRPVARGDQQVLWLLDDPSALGAAMPATCDIVERADGTSFLHVRSAGPNLVALDVELDFAAERPFLVATERTREMRAIVRRDVGWTGAPRYGLPPTRQQRLMVPTDSADRDATLQIERYDAGGLSIRSCEARAYAPPDYDALPGFAEYFAKAGR